MKRLILLFILVLLAVPVFGSVNVLTGNLSYRQDLFATQGGPQPLRMALQYNSYDGIDGQVGVGWSHSYEIYLHENSDGTLVLTGGLSKRFYFYNSQTTLYEPRIGDYSNLTANGDGTYTIDFPSGTVYQFGSDKKLTSITDRYGNSLSFDYSVADQLTVTDPTGRSCLIHFDANGRVDYVQDPAGSQFDFIYNTNGQLETVTNPEPQLGNGRAVYTFNYTADGLLEYITDPNQQIRKYEYTDGKVTRSVRPEGVIDTGGSETVDSAQYSKTYAYSSTTPLTRNLNFNGALPQTTLTERDGGQWVYVYNYNEGQLAAKQNPLGLTTEYSYYPSTDSNYGQRQYTLKPMEVSSDGLTVTYQLTSYNSYDANGNPLDISTQVRTVTYDGTGAPVSTVDDPVHSQLTYTYGTYNRPTSITDVIAGTTTTINYAPQGDGTEIVTLTAPKINSADAMGPQTVLVYRADGQLSTITDPLFRVVTYSYDGTGQLTGITDPNNIVSSFSNFDALGMAQTVTLTGSDGTSTRDTALQYDALAQLIQLTQGATTPLITEFDYDGTGNRNYVLDAEQNETTFEHNSQGQITKITNTLNPGLPEEQILDTILDYSGAGCPSCGGAGDKLKILTDAKNQQTMFAYDSLGRLEKETDPLNKVIGYSYYADGRPKQKFLGEPSTGTLLLTYEYTADGKLQAKKDALNTIFASYSYDAQNRLQVASTPDSTYSLSYYDNGWLKTVDNGSYQIEYQYDDLGRREYVTVKQNATVLQTIDYVYDPTTKDLKDIVSSNAGTFIFGYDAFGRRATLSYPNGIQGTYSYDDVNQMDWLKSIVYTDGAAGPDILTIGYPLHDNVGNRKQRTEDGITTDYAYDDLYRVTNATTGTSAENFSYDAVGNRESGPTVKDTAAASYDHNIANQMLLGRKHSYDYDDQGNQSHRYLNAAKTKYWQYSWSEENQLKQAQLINDSSTLRTINFKYDAFGHRIEKEVIDPLATTTTSYIYDSEDIVLQIIDDGATTSTTHYTHGPGIDEPLAQTENGQSNYYHADGLGSILALTNSTKEIVQRYSYDTFGMLTNIQAPEFNNAYTYTSREWDKELGLYYYRARYYDPMEGRFISKDPISLSGGDVNLYAYVLNNPTYWIDPAGYARYSVYWNTKGVSVGPASVIKVQGSVISMERNENGLYDAVNFEGTLYGMSASVAIAKIGKIPIGVSWTNNSHEIFEDSSPCPDVTGVAGDSWLASGSVAVVGNEGVSGGGQQFGNLIGTNTNISTNVEGFDIGSTVGKGVINLKGKPYETDWYTWH